MEGTKLPKSENTVRKPIGQAFSPFHDAPTTGPRGRAGPTKTPQRPSRCRYTPHDPPSAARKRAHRRAPSIRPVLPARPSPTAGTAWGASARPWGCRAARPDTCAGLPVVLQAPMVLGASRGLHGRPARRRARPRQRDLDPTVTSGAHGGSRRVPRSRAGAPRGHLAHARQRQPRGHRARRLRPEGEAARTIIRRAGAAHAAAGGRRALSKLITMAAVAGMHRAVHGRRAARVQRAAHGAQGGHAARLRARRGPGWPRASCRKDRRRSSRRSACFWSPSALFAWQLGQLCAPRGASRARAARRHGPARRLDRVRRARRAHGAEGAILPPGGRDFYGAPAGLYDMKTR